MASITNAPGARLQPQRSATTRLVLYPYPTMSHSLSSNKDLDVGRVGIEQDNLPPWQDGVIDLRSWFGPETTGWPLELEIGSGKGTFLVQQAERTPEVLYIGIEYAKAFWRHAADRCRRHGLENRVRLLHAEAGFFIRNYVPDNLLHQVHIYFPDPWPKKRHNKRRLVQAEFLRMLHTKLVVPAQQGEAGLVRLATDHADYFAWMRAAAAEVSDLYEMLPFESPASAEAGELVGTNFERKYQREGRTFNGMILAKRTDAPSGETPTEGS